MHSIRYDKMILPISDIHSHRKSVVKGIKEIIKSYIPVDYITISGDVLESRNTPEDFKELMDLLLSINSYIKVVFISGNHDYLDYSDLIAKYNLGDRVHYLMNELKVIDGIPFYGSPLSLPFGNWNYMLDEAGIAATLQATMSRNIAVALFHSPPYCHGDLVDNDFGGADRDKHVGSKAILNAINCFMPRYAFYGHIHEGDHTLTKINRFTYGKNVSFLDGDYQITDKTLNSIELIRI